MRHKLIKTINDCAFQYTAYFYSTIRLNFTICPNSFKWQCGLVTGLSAYINEESIIHIIAVLKIIQTVHILQSIKIL